MQRSGFQQATTVQVPPRWWAVAGLCLAAAGSATAQDLYFAQPYATRMQTNPAYAGLLDDYSITLSYRNQFPTLAGTFQTSQLAADYRFRDQHSAAGLLLDYDRTGGLGYTRFQAGGVYAYHLRLNEQLSLSGGASLSYGLQRVSYSNLVFGDQLSDDGVERDFSLEVADFQPVHYVHGRRGRTTLYGAVLVGRGGPAPQPAQPGLRDPNPTAPASEPANGL